jgi:tripartite-type tricarboxylate transporter receptor subunit TctC
MTTRSAWLLGVCVLFASNCFAQPFPAKPIRIIVPFPAGGTTDVAARMVGQRMSESMGQPVLVENRAGAGGQIGADVVAKAAPDGYTLLMHNVAFPLGSIVAAQANRAMFNIDTDFAGVSIVIYVPFVILAHPGVPAKDLRELGTLLQNNKTLRYAYGSTGPGSGINVLFEAFNREAKVDIAHVPYKGAAPLKQDLLAGRVQLGGDQLSTSLAEIRDGTLRSLATHSARRAPTIPDVPTVRELGYASLEYEGWNGLFAPAKTPKEVIDRLQREVATAVRHPEVTKRLTELAAEPVGSSAAEQDAILRRQIDQFRPIIREMRLE